MQLDEAGLERAAILLMTVGEEQAAEVFKFLSPKEVQKLGETMARLKTVPREKVEQVIAAFNKTKDEQYSLVGDTDASSARCCGARSAKRRPTCCSTASCKGATSRASKR